MVIARGDTHNTRPAHAAAKQEDLVTCVRARAARGLELAWEWRDRAPVSGPDIGLLKRSCSGHPPKKYFLHANSLHAPQLRLHALLAWLLAHRTAMMTRTPRTNMHIRLTMNAPDRMLGPNLGIRERRMNMRLWMTRQIV